MTDPPWTCAPEQLAGGRGVRLVPRRGGAQVSYAEVVAGWRGDAAFRSFFNRTLADVPFAGFRWETPPVTAATAGRPFECVVLDAAGFGSTADPEPFAATFAAAAGRDAVAFPNLGGDAVLVAPCPAGPPAAYGHLAAFVRHAADARRQALWQAVGDAVHARLSDRPLWLSTAGYGVAWLHVRLDDRPKYYGHGPYREPPGPTGVAADAATPA